jgi:hypothetical protein
LAKAAIAISKYLRPIRCVELAIVLYVMAVLHIEAQKRKPGEALQEISLPSSILGGVEIGTVKYRL